MEILVDMDGILVDTLPRWLDRINELTGVRAWPEDIVDWNMHKNYPLTVLDPKTIFDILNEPGFTLSLPEMSGAARNLKKLHEDGHDISLLTARYGTQCMPETLVWLQKVMPWFDIERKTWFCHEKTRITGDVLIDDKTETLINYRRKRPSTKLIAIDYPYNQAAEVDFRVPKSIHSWDRIREYIEALQLAQRP